MQQIFDVAIAGSGPAGAAAAIRLVRDGYSVALIDERDFPRHKLCGEYLNLGTLRELRDVGMAEKLEPLALVLRGMHLYAHAESAAFQFPDPAWSIPRTALDHTIRNGALEAGAQPIRARVRDIEERDASVVLSLESGGERSTLEARYVIAADGMRSTIARLLRLSRPVRSARFATGGHYAARVGSDWVEMYAGAQGYLAINPLSSDSANAMFVFGAEHFRRHRDDIPGELERFSRQVSAERYALREDLLLERRRTTGPLAHETSSPVRGRVMLVGDAARFVDPFTGQGVFLALAGARLASAAVASALRKEATQPRAWHEFTRELSSLYRERERIALMMRILLVSRALSRRAARVLRRRPGDFAPLIDAVCAKTTVSIPELCFSLGRAMR